MCPCWTYLSSSVARSGEGWLWSIQVIVERTVLKLRMLVRKHDSCSLNDGHASGDKQPDG